MPRSIAGTSSVPERHFLLVPHIATRRQRFPNVLARNLLIAKHHLELRVSAHDDVAADEAAHEVLQRAELIALRIRVQEGAPPDQNIYRCQKALVGELEACVS